MQKLNDEKKKIHLYAKFQKLRSERENEIILRGYFEEKKRKDEIKN
jgi:hypothetical protein